MHVFNNFIIVLSEKNKYIFLQLTLTDTGIIVCFSSCFRHLGKVPSALLLLILLILSHKNHTGYIAVA